MIRTPVELAVTFAVVAGVIAATAPSCVRSVRARRSTEATENLERLAEGVRAQLAAKKNIEPTPMTPANVPRGAPQSDAPGTWNHPTWAALGFALDEPHWYAYEVSIADPERLVRVVAHGDLDGDGVFSRYERSVRREPSGEWVIDRALIVTRDLE